MKESIINFIVIASMVVGISGIIFIVFHSIITTNREYDTLNRLHDYTALPKQLSLNISQGKSALSENRIKQFFEKIISIWGQASIPENHQQIPYGPGLIVFPSPRPFSANDWILHITELHSASKKCLIELEQEYTEFGYYARWKCSSEEQLLSRGHLTILVIDSERNADFYLDDLFDSP